MSEFVFIMTCWLSGERSLPFGLLVFYLELQNTAANLYSHFSYQLIPSSVVLAHNENDKDN